MTTQQCTPVPAEDGLRSAMAELTAVFENLGAEHEALMLEQSRTCGRERRSTVVRMDEAIASASDRVRFAADSLALVYGMRSLGISSPRFSKGAEGHDYPFLTPLGGSTDARFDVVEYLGEAVAHLVKAYEPTRDHPALAVARCPGQMKVVLSGLQSALDVVGAEFCEDEVLAGECASARTVLAGLEERVFSAVPAQAVRQLSVEEMSAAIESDPELASAAAAALVVVAVRDGDPEMTVTAQARLSDALARLDVHRGR
ncbi:hypothetical protein EV284_6366 [Streptomyces sp. BK022]|uniref:hypothetical protein n=1 Tax=Streptomyces sp. BK022 TaxID=2512123 RepID=UPI00102956B2|nr:hypothetical protein [Streptomyces sp. BK022]RZU28200.1 hypothetical protein EV284_6366 [Streptomyces sp. BK022]